MSNLHHDGGCEHHSQAGSFRDYTEKERPYPLRQYYTEYRYVDGRWQARLAHRQTPQQALEEDPPEWINL